MSTRTLFPVILGSGGPSGNYAVNLNMTMDSNYIISAQLVDQNGDALGTEQTIDLPLESVVVSGRYDSQSKSLILTLQNGNTITIPVGDLVSGLQTTIDSNNPLNVDYTTDGTTNKVFTAAEQSKLSGIAAGAEVNVQADWNQSDSTADDYIKNKPTIPTVNDATITLQDDGGTTIDSFTLNQSANKTITIPSGGGGSVWYGSQEQFDLIPEGQLDQNTTYYISGKLDYDKDLTNKPVIPTNTNQLTNGADFQDKTQVSAEVMSGLGYLDKTNVYLTQTEFDTMRTAGTLKPGYTYHIQGDMTTVQMVVTFTDQSTATYDVFVKA